MASMILPIAVLLCKALIVWLILAVVLRGVTARFFRAGNTDLNLINAQSLRFERFDQVAMVLVQFTIGRSVLDHEADGELTIHHLQIRRDRAKAFRCHFDCQRIQCLISCQPVRDIHIACCVAAQDRRPLTVARHGRGNIRAIAGAHRRNDPSAINDLDRLHHG